MAVPKVLKTETFVRGAARPAPGQLDAAAHHHHVHVGGRTPQVVVAHVPPTTKDTQSAFRIDDARKICRNRDRRASVRNHARRSFQAAPVECHHRIFGVRM